MVLKKFDRKSPSFELKIEISIKKMRERETEAKRELIEKRNLHIFSFSPFRKIESIESVLVSTF